MSSGKLNPILLFFAFLFGGLCVTGQTPARPDASEAVQLALQVVELYKQHKYEEALPLAKRCLEIRSKLFTDEDEPLRAALTNLAEIYAALRRYEDAEPFFRRLAKSYEKSAPNDLRFATVLQRLATIKTIQGDGNSAVSLNKRAIEITERVLGPDDQRLADAIYYLAEYYLRNNDLKNAEPLFRRLMLIREKDLNDERLKSTLDRYTCLLQKMGQDDQADELQRRVMNGVAARNNDKDRNYDSPIIGGVLNGRAITLPRPDYPEEARATKTAGTVVVRVLIDERGKVIRACAFKGPKVLMEVSEAAAFRSIFSPTKLSGQPVKVTGVITYNFVAR